MSSQHSGNVTAKVRCWPGGRVLQSINREFSAAPLEGDVIEVTSHLEVVVNERRFDPDGLLNLRCLPIGDCATWPTDKFEDEWDQARYSKQGQ